MLVTISAGFLIAIAEAFTESFNSELYVGGFTLLLFWPTVAVHAKRWHDRDRTAWWLLLAISPFTGPAYLVAFWVLIECAFIPGTPEDNRFGPVPAGSLGTNGKEDRYQPALIALFIGLVIVSTSFPRYRIPSGAMMPTLLVGDFILASRVAYGIPMPFTHQEAVHLNSPIRGDVIIFLYPPSPSTVYIKRVVGEPGDRIAYSEKQVYINGERLPQFDMDVYNGAGSGARETGALRKVEKLGDVEHSILIHPERPDFAPACGDMQGYELTVPEDHYFVMGDNRDNSNDSRCWGFVSREYIIGKALMVLMNWDSKREELPIVFEIRNISTLIIEMPNQQVKNDAQKARAS